MILWIIFTCLWIHIDTAAKSDKELVEVTANQLHVVWHSTTPSVHDDVTTNRSDDDVLASLTPFFDDTASFLNVTVQLGGTAILHCRVSELTDKTTVSWMRRQEGHLDLVSVGLDIYSSDSRYTVRLQQPNDWTLSLQEAQEGDEGLYECQVSSHPPLVHNLHLHVVVPELEIWDERGIPTRNKFYNAGSTIELRCSILKVPRPSHFILWKHGVSVLNYDVTRGGISVKTDLLPDGVKSGLTIAHVGPLDSGNYTCSLADVAEATVMVHVLNGETPAAMQHGGAGQQLPAALSSLLLGPLTSYLLLNTR